MIVSIICHRQNRSFTFEADQKGKYSIEEGLSLIFNTDLNQDGTKILDQLVENCQNLNTFVLMRGYSCRKINRTIQTISQRSNQLEDLSMTFILGHPFLLDCGNFITNLINLKCLRIRSVEFKDRNLWILFDSCPSLQKLQLLSCTFTRKSFEYISCKLPKLKELNIYDCNLDDEMAQVIAVNNSLLKRISMTSNKITQVGIESVLEKCSQLCYLHVVCKNSEFLRELSFKYPNVVFHVR